MVCPLRQTVSSTFGRFSFSGSHAVAVSPFHRIGIDMRDYVEWAQIAFGSRGVCFNRAHHDAFVDSFKQIAKAGSSPSVSIRIPSHGRVILRPAISSVANFFRHVTGDREAEAAIHPVNQRVHADHFAVDIAQWAAAVAGINRGVSLQIIGDGVGAGLKQFAPAFAADHTVSERVIKLEWCPYRERKLAYPHPIAVSQLDNRQIFGIDLDDRDVGLFVCADDLCRKIRGRPSILPRFCLRLQPRENS